MAASEAVSTMRSGWGCPSVTFGGLLVTQSQAGVEDRVATLEDHGAHAAHGMAWRQAGT